MFDLDMIEADWLNNSFILSEEEIIEIYRSENITLSNYNDQIEEYRTNNRFGVSLEEKIWQTLLGNYKETMERKNELRKKYEFPVKKHLSQDLQNMVIEGSMHIVFSSTRQLYEFFDGKLSMEDIYYVCLEALINSTKYILHCEKPVFELYVLKSIEKNIIKHVAKIEKITYREAYKVIKAYFANSDCDYSLKTHSQELRLSLDNGVGEVLEKPSKIFYRLKNDSYDVDYIKGISSTEFMSEYVNALDDLDDITRMVMQMSFDIEGNRGLTNTEIDDYLGIKPKKVSDIRKKAIKILRKDKRLIKYCK